MVSGVEIRAIRPEDIQQAVDLDRRGGWDGRVDPDPALQQEMFARAARAEAAGDPLWVPNVWEGLTVAGEIDRALAFWVAAETGSSENLLGTVGVQGPSARGDIPPQLVAEHWWLDPDVVELVRLRVDRSLHRRGIGAALSQAAIDLAREHGYRRMILNTSAPQLPAQGLYRSLGFQIVARSYLGTYELVWHEFAL